MMILSRNIFAEPLLPVQRGNTLPEYIYSTKSLGVVIDKREIKYIKYAESYGNETSMLKEILIQAEDTYFKTIIPLVTFSISVWGRFFPATFVEIKGLHLKAGKIIEWLPKNIMDCDILQRVHRQNLGWFYKRRLAIEMSKAKHMLNRLCQYVYKCGLVRGKGLRKLIEISRKKRQSLGGGGAVDWNCLLLRKDCSKI